VKKGDIILIPFPFTDLSGLKNRPALILIEGQNDITVSFITSQIKWKEEFDIKVSPSAENGLKRTSLIRLNKLATIDKELVIGKLGALSTKILSEVDNSLVKIFNLQL